MRSQEQLRQRLSSRGFDVTQATLSRDIKELGLLKRSSDGAYQPAGADSTSHASALDTLGRALSEYLVNIEPVQQLVVLKTGAGTGAAAGAGDRSIATARGRRHARRRRHHPDHRPRREERAGGGQAAEGPRQLKPIVVLAYSGGARSTAAIPWLADRHRAEVVTVTLDLGQSGDMNEIRDAGAVGRRGARARDRRARGIRARHRAAVAQGRRAVGYALSDGDRADPAADREDARADRRDRERRARGARRDRPRSPPPGAADLDAQSDAEGNRVRRGSRIRARRQRDAAAAIASTTTCGAAPSAAAATMARRSPTSRCSRSRGASTRRRSSPRTSRSNSSAAPPSASTA